VPKQIDIPTNVGFTNSNFKLVRAVSVAASPFSGKYRTQEYDMVYWTGNVSLPPMRRADAVEWQAFFLDLVGTRNYFLFNDPDSKVPRGTNSGGYLFGEVRVNSGVQVTSVTLSFSGSTITAGTAIFDGLVAGEYITVSGANNEDNNGTFKITTKTSNTVVVVDHNLTTEAGTTACKVRQNVKGSTALTLEASSDSATGTIKKGDYLAIYDGSTTSSNPIQLVMATADVSPQVLSGRDSYNIPIQPKLRQAITAGTVIGFSSSYNKSKFRLTNPVVEWDANNVSTYGLSFEFIEVI
jgi:hypothetical protein